MLADIKERYHIPTAKFIGHDDVAPRRKVDPSRHFPWKTLAASGVGMWCDPPYAPAPLTLDPEAELRALGYNTADLAAAVQAFKQHFLPEEQSPVLGEQGRALLYCLYRKASG